MAVYFLCIFPDRQRCLKDLRLHQRCSRLARVVGAHFVGVYVRRESKCRWVIRLSWIQCSQSKSLFVLYFGCDVIRTYLIKMNTHVYPPFLQITLLGVDTRVFRNFDNHFPVFPHSGAKTALTTNTPPPHTHISPPLFQLKMVSYPKPRGEKK